MGFLAGILASLLRYVFNWHLWAGRGGYPLDNAAHEANRIWTEAGDDIKTGGRVAPEVDFVSTAVPVQGTVNYADLKWDDCASVKENTDEFSFYDGKTLLLRIRKSNFKNHGEIQALRRVIRRRVTSRELQDD